ncbi:hypothetical protein COO60DRAFT_1484426 [Scenedesmus sp. NREL 46B-D3]|nr:hypothetical protein COO60DRAFT_1484426 [Scenedesmus sp. NREL 46B-D3]
MATDDPPGVEGDEPAAPGLDAAGEAAPTPAAVAAAAPAAVDQAAKGTEEQHQHDPAQYSHHGPPGYEYYSYYGYPPGYGAPGYPPGYGALGGQSMLSGSLLLLTISWRRNYNAISQRVCRGEYIRPPAQKQHWYTMSESSAAQQQLWLPVPRALFAHTPVLLQWSVHVDLNTLFAPWSV